MQDWEDYQEIENLGEEEPDPQPARNGGKGRFSTVPLAQAVVCALILLALVFLKLTDPESYQKAAGWYQSEAAREIELPSWAGRETDVSPAPETPSSAPGEELGVPQEL